MVKVRKPRNTSTSAIIIDYDQFKELYNIDFRRTYDDEPAQEEIPDSASDTTLDKQSPLPDSTLLFQAMKDPDKPF